MQGFLRSFREHPESVGENYAQHWWSAMRFAGGLFVAAIACCIHAFVPALFEGTASRAVNGLYRRMVTGRARNRTGKAPAGEPRAA
jgi:hypothetical protein